MSERGASSVMEFSGGASLCVLRVDLEGTRSGGVTEHANAGVAMAMARQGPAG